MNNVTDFPSEDINYITGRDGEPTIVGVICKDISIQLSCDLHNILLGDIEIKREELIAFILGVGIHYDFADQLSKSVDSDEVSKLKRKIVNLKNTLQCIADNPEWNDHHCRAKAAIDKAI